MLEGNPNLKITYVSPNSKTVEEQLNKYLPRATFIHIRDTFTGFLEKIKASKFPEYNFFKV
jgi:hypothetical protein